MFRPSGNKKGTPANVPDHDPPAGYICYRCGEKGHWIQVCPTNDDPNFDNKPRVKRTTGIPRSFLKTVEKPAALNGDGSEDAKPPSGVMVNAEGEFVIAEPDKASWELFQAKTKSSAAAQKAAALGDKELQDRGLECSIDKKIFIDPMKTPCCEKTYCNECITNALIESDFTCPGCQADGVLIDDLKPDEETSAKIKAYLDEKNAELKKEKERSRSPSVKPETASSTETKESAGKTSPPKLSPKSPVKSESAEKPASPKAGTPEKAVKLESAPMEKTDSTSSKKRSADELLENPKVPKAPKAMQQQQTQKAPSQQSPMMNGANGGMNGMPGFPNMPFDMSQQFYGMNGFNGMPNFNMMNGYNMGMPMMPMGGNPMMNPMMGMNNFGGYPNVNNMNMFPGQGGYGGGMGMGMNGNMGMNMNGGGMNGVGGVSGFPNQQKTVFADPLPSEEDNAYFRKPVNPHRHQGRQRRVRPSDYTEL